MLAAGDWQVIVCFVRWTDAFQGTSGHGMSILHTAVIGQSALPAHEPMSKSVTFADLKSASEEV